MQIQENEAARGMNVLPDNPIQNLALASVSLPTSPDTTGASVSENDPETIQISKLGIGLDSSPTPNKRILRKSWRPLSLLPLSMIAFMMFQVGILVGIEVLYQRSAANTGLLTVNEDYSTVKVFAWSYLPTAISLMAAIWWACLNMDIQMTDLWVRLSTPAGAGTKSIFKNEYRNPFTAPMISLRQLFNKKNNTKLCSFTIFCSAVGHVTSFLILPPLQASFMTQSNVTASLRASFIQMPAFNGSNTIISGVHLYDFFLKSILGYFGLPIAESVWISGGVAVLPSTPLDGNLQGATWETTTTAYTSSLHCESCSVSQLIYIDAEKAHDLSLGNSMPGKTRLNFSSLQYPISAIFSNLGEKGACQFRIDVPLAQGLDPTGPQSDEWYYGGWGRLSPATEFSNAQVDAACDQYQYLGVNYATLNYSASQNQSSFDYDVMFGVEPSFNALLCRSTYEVVPDLKVNFTNSILSPTFNYSSEEFNHSRLPISSSVFNSSLFEEYLMIDLAKLRKNSSYSTVNTNGQPTIIQKGFVPLTNYFGSFEFTNLELYLNMTDLATWTEQYLQAAFVQRIDLAGESWTKKPAERLDLEVAVTLNRIVVNSAYARATQATLALLIFLTILTTLLTWKRIANLRSNPSTIAAKAALVHQSDELLKNFREHGFKNNLIGNFGRYRLEELESGGVKLISLNQSLRQDPVTRTGSVARNSLFKWKILLVVGLTLFATSILIIIIVLWVITQKNSGLSPGSFHLRIDSVNQFAWTIVPVLAIIVVKFVWSQVDEYFRILQPYINLVRDPVGPKGSVCINYERTLIGWVTVKAALKKHWVLGVVTFLSLANEVLVVAMSALFTSITLPVAESKLFFHNTTLRIDSTNLTNVLDDYDKILNLAVTIGENSFDFPDLAVIASSLGGKPAPWTTVEYAFQPAYLNKSSEDVGGDPQNTNWTVPTIGVRGTANCRDIDLPLDLFDKIPVVGSGSSAEDALYGYELHDWSSGIETSQNTITVNQSILRIPQRVTGPQVRPAVTAGSLTGVLNYIGFWGPLWTANVDESGNITFANISLPGPIPDNAKNNRSIRTLPEIEFGRFGAGWVDFHRVRAPNTSLWYSLTPTASFVVCEPAFEWVNSTVTVDAATSQVLDYTLHGPHTSINGSGDLEAWYEADGTTRARAGLGSLFTILAIFQSETPTYFLWLELDFIGDIVSQLALSVSESGDAADLTKPDILRQAVERGFTALFSQYAAVPGLVFTAADAPIPIAGNVVDMQTRIVMSRTAFIIVVSILSTLILAMILVAYIIYHLRNTLSQLSHEPATIGAVIALICDSENFLAQFEGVEGLNEMLIKERLCAKKTRYKMGMFAKGDGQRCFGIEVDELAEWVDDRSAKKSKAS